MCTMPIFLTCCSAEITIMSPEASQVHGGSKQVELQPSTNCYEHMMSKINWHFKDYIPGNHQQFLSPRENSVGH